MILKFFIKMWYIVLIKDNLISYIFKVPTKDDLVLLKDDFDPIKDNLAMIFLPKIFVILKVYLVFLKTFFFFFYIR